MRKLGLVLAVMLATACGGGDDDGGDEGGGADAGDPDAAGGGDGSLVVTNMSVITIAELYVDDSDNLLTDFGLLMENDSVTLEGISCADHELLLIDDTDVGCLISSIQLCDTLTIDSALYDMCE